MQIIVGNKPEMTTLKEIQQQVPSRLLRFLLRVAQLRQGRYVIYFSVGEDGLPSWSVADMGQVER